MTVRTNQMMLCLKISSSADRYNMFVISESRVMTLHFDNGKVTTKESLVSYKHSHVGRLDVEMLR